MSISIKVSELFVLSEITSDDYIIVNDSGSVSTKRATFNTMKNWMTGSGMIVSSSYTSISSSYAKSASLATSASYALSSSYSNSASYARSSSVAVSSSYALSSSYGLISNSASYSLSASFSLSSSYAKSASLATSASYALSSSYGLISNSASYSLSASLVTSASYALSSSYGLFSLSSSYAKSASFSLSASYALSSSYAIKSDQSTSSSYAVSASYSSNGGGSSIMAAFMIVEEKFSIPGNYNWQIPIPLSDPTITSVDALLMIVGGGGAGGSQLGDATPSNYSGCGGAGGIILVKNIKLKTTEVYTVKVGNGGAAGSWNAGGSTNGENSSFSGICIIQNSDISLIATSTGGSVGGNGYGGVGGSGGTSTVSAPVDYVNFPTPSGQNGNSIAVANSGSYPGNIRSNFIGADLQLGYGLGGVGGRGDPPSNFRDPGAGGSGQVVIKYLYV